MITREMEINKFQKTRTELKDTAKHLWPATLLLMNDDLCVSRVEKQFHLSADRIIAFHHSAA